MYYLIEHNRNTKETNIEEYLHFAQASAERFSREINCFLQGKNEVEMVVFETDSEETLIETHSRYFTNPNAQITRGKEKHKSLIKLGCAATLVALAIKLLKKP